MKKDRLRSLFANTCENVEEAIFFTSGECAAELKSVKCDQEIKRLKVRVKINKLLLSAVISVT